MPVECLAYTTDGTIFYDCNWRVPVLSRKQIDEHYKSHCEKHENLQADSPSHVSTIIHKW